MNTGDIIRNKKSGKLFQVVRVDLTDTRGPRVLARSLKVDGVTTTGPMRNMDLAGVEVVR
jgi:hypothetical protein